MKKILFALILSFFAAITLSAQVSVYEYKDDNIYCTFELNSQLASDSVQIKGTYRAYKFYDIPYFEMTFLARSYLLPTGEAVISITPDFYYHAYLAKLIGEREAMDSKYYKLTFVWMDDTISNITPEADSARLLKKSNFTKKGQLNFTKFPSTFTKAKTIDWKKFPKELRKSLQEKDKVMGRKY